MSDHYFKRLLAVFATAIALGWLGLTSCHAAAFPYITLNKQTNRLSDNGTALTFNGTPLGTTSVTYGAVTNALVLTGATNTFLRSDGTQATPPGGSSVFTVTNNGATLLLTGTPTNTLQLSSQDTFEDIILIANSAVAVSRTNTYQILGLGINILNGSALDTVSDVLAIGDGTLSSTVITNASQDIVAIGDGVLDQSLLDGISTFDFLGAGAGAQMKAHGAANILGFGTPLVSSRLTNGTQFVEAIGHRTLSGSTLDNCYSIIASGVDTLRTAHLTNSSDIIAIGDSAGYGLSGAGLNNLIMIGNGITATNVNDAVIGNANNNYFFPGASMRVEGPVSLGSTVTTADPGSGTAAWELGKVIEGASVTLVTTNYVEVNIGGSVVKLAIVQ